MSPTANIDLAAQLSARGMSQWKLAAATGIHPSQISRYVSGGVEPSPRSAAKIAEALRARKGDR
jgi:transcriptional regulator with XRE-family HTH domain